MKLTSTPRRLLQLDALFARRGHGVEARREPQLDAQDTRLPDDSEFMELLARQDQPPGCQIGRLAAEVALEEGGRRFYTPRDESEVLDPRRQR